MGFSQNCENELFVSTLDATEEVIFFIFSWRRSYWNLYEYIPRHSSFYSVSRESLPVFLFTKLADEVTVAVGVGSLNSGQQFLSNLFNLPNLLFPSAKDRTIEK